MFIADLSKHLRYNFCYNHLKNEYADRVQLLFTDTDSLLVDHMDTKDIYKDMGHHADLYDTRLEVIIEKITPFTLWSTNNIGQNEG